MEDILFNIVGTVLGGILLTLILFLLNEFVFVKENLTGEWKTVLNVQNTSYKPFENLTIEYKIHMIQKGYELNGSGEKIKNISKDGVSTTFLRVNRVILNIDGYLERKYFGKSIIYLNIQEEGTQRRTRATYILVLKNNKLLEGEFVSTAADAKGKIKMVKD